MPCGGSTSQRSYGRHRLGRGSLYQSPSGCNAVQCVPTPVMLRQPYRKYLSMLFVLIAAAVDADRFFYALDSFVDATDVADLQGLSDLRLVQPADVVQISGLYFFNWTEPRL